MENKHVMSTGEALAYLGTAFGVIGLFILGIYSGMIALILGGLSFYLNERNAAAVAISVGLIAILLSLF